MALFSSVELNWFVPPQEIMVKEIFHTVWFHGCLSYRVCCLNKFLAGNFNYKDHLFKSSYAMYELGFTLSVVGREVAVARVEEVWFGYS